MKNLLKLAMVLVFISGCGSDSVNKNIQTVVLDYKHFGPQAMAHSLLGMEWWSWQPHGDSRPRDYKIKVVVYRGIDLSQVKTSYPVNQSKEQDYRYIEYSMALQYLDKNIQENVISEVTALLKSTRNKINFAFANK